MQRRCPRWPWASLSLGLVLLSIAVWPDGEHARHQPSFRGGLLLLGESKRPVEREIRPPSISGHVPPMRPWRSHAQPPPLREPAAKPLQPHRTTDEQPPLPADMLEPPPPPLFPLWAYLQLTPRPKPAPTTTPNRFDPTAPRRAVERAIRDRDAEIGLDLPGAGRIAGHLASAVRGHTPPVSVGTFDARVTSDGEVIDIRVRSFSGGSVAGWTAAASDAMAEIVGTELPLPSHLRSGARVTVRIEQDLEHPSGSGRKPRRDVRPMPERPSWPYLPKPGRVSRQLEPIVSTKDLLPPDMAGLGDPETMMPPCNTDGSGCNEIPADLADLGTTAARVVRAYIFVAPILASLIGPRRIVVNKRTRKPD